MYGYIYKITDSNGKFYVGKHKSEVIDENYWGSGVIIKNIIAKNGTDSLKREILGCCDSLDKLNSAEKFWIMKLDALNRNKAYNIALGGDGGDLTSNFRWYNDGKKDYYISVNDVVPQNLIKGRVIDNSNSLNYVWINNGKEQRTIPKVDLYKYKDYKLGMLPMKESHKDCIKKYQSNRPESHNKNISLGKKQFFDEHPDFRNSGNWVKGQTALNKDKQSITNGLENHYIDMKDFPYWEKKGFYLGNTQKHNRRVKAINNSDGTFKWVSIKSVDRYTAQGYTIDYDAVGNTHKIKKGLNSND